MSNCIQLHDHTVKFTEDEFDISGFEKLAEEHKGHPHTPEVSDTFCWFIRNTYRIIQAPGNRDLQIAFGNGRSGHTWRDFKHTVWLLNQFIKKPKTHTFMVADEYDGFDSLCKLPIQWPYTSLDELWEKF